MATMFHSSARTTLQIQVELLASQEKTGILAPRYGLNGTTVMKWQLRITTTDVPMSPAQPKSTVLSLAEKVFVVEFRHRPGAGK